jgi:hypothetical protein
MAIAHDDSRATDADDYLKALDRIWQFGDVSDANLIELRDKLSGFEELQGGEEPPGIRAYAYDAVAALYYTLAYLTSGERINVVYCSNHMLNSVGFIDDAQAAGSRHYDDEVNVQRENINRLRTGNLEVPTLRGESQEFGRHRAEAVASLFQ